jgi:Spy/CpxP family protein refolding chaperone
MERTGGARGDEQMTKRKWVLAGMAAVLACGAASTAFAGGGHAAKKAARSGESVRQAAQARRRRMAEFLASLNVTDEQRALVLDKARAAAPIVAGARDEVRKIVARAWASAAKDSGADRKAIRATVQSDVQAVREKARAQIEPLARDVVASLTPEQRQKFQDAFAARGRTMDDAKLTRLAARLISRPMTVAYLEARTAK